MKSHLFSLIVLLLFFSPIQADNHKTLTLNTDHNKTTRSSQKERIIPLSPALEEIKILLDEQQNENKALIDYYIKRHQLTCSAEKSYKECQLYEDDKSFPALILYLNSERQILAYASNQIESTQETHCKKIGTPHHIEICFLKNLLYKSPQTKSFVGNSTPSNQELIEVIYTQSFMKYRK